MSLTGKRSLLYTSAVVTVVSILAGTLALAQENSNLPRRGSAPELRSLTWLNTDTPLRLEGLRGKVVLLEFWTFDCINCIHTLPYVEAWHQSYHDQGLAVIGIHFPEFGYERNLDNVFAATQRLNVTYPVGIDNDGATWDAYGQRYWPTMYLIDKQGAIRYTRIGEGAYDQTERAIQTLLAEPYAPPELADLPPALTYLTPDTVMNVRAAPTIDSARLGSAQPSMAFVITGTRGDWYEISYNDGVGYVSGDYVTLHNE
ncbi:MAG: redoxin domain-containing protein [Anaerolineae bacterium]